MKNEDISELVRKAHHDGFMARDYTGVPFDAAIAEEGAWEASDVIIQLDTMLKTPATTYASYKGIYGRFVVTASGMCDGCCYDSLNGGAPVCEYCRVLDKDDKPDGIFVECSKEEYDANTTDS